MPLIFHGKNLAPIGRTDRKCWADGIVLRIDPDQPRASHPPLAEFACQTRDLVDRGLRTPAQMVHADSGVTRLVPPIDSSFQLDRVLLRTDTVPPEIRILFRWAGEQALFGVRETVEQEDMETDLVGVTAAEEFASMILISLEENLLACGYGIENAIQESQGDVTWLRWNTKPSASTC